MHMPGASSAESGTGICGLSDSYTRHVAQHAPLQLKVYLNWKMLSTHGTALPVKVAMQGVCRPRPWQH